ncbi:MAG: hypothetical protein D3916_15925, partial [Candidatus Electrothrix sp. MAN1_4]|nr:hypothetical protein [Candidatus Electrothrix sp. MAN1_4]
LGGGGWVAGDWRERLTGEQIDRIIKDHGEVMRRFGYLDATGRPLHPPRPLPEKYTGKKP